MTCSPDSPESFVVSTRRTSPTIAALSRTGRAHARSAISVQPFLRGCDMQPELLTAMSRRPLGRGRLPPKLDPPYIVAER